MLVNWNGGRMDGKIEVMDVGIDEWMDGRLNG